MFADQLNEFTENIKTKFESRLTALDRAGAEIKQCWTVWYLKLFNIISVSNIDTNMASLTGRAHLWDSFHLHIEAWNSQLTSLEQKIEIMRRFNILSINRMLKNYLFSHLWNLMHSKFWQTRLSEKVLDWKPNQGNYQSFQMFSNFERKEKINIRFVIFLSIAESEVIPEENIPTSGSNLSSHNNGDNSAAALNMN